MCLSIGRHVRESLQVVRELWDDFCNISEFMTTHSYVTGLAGRLQFTCKLVTESVPRQKGFRRLTLTKRPNFMYFQVTTV